MKAAKLSFDSDHFQKFLKEEQKGEVAAKRRR